MLLLRSGVGNGTEEKLKWGSGTLNTKCSGKESDSYSRWLYGAVEQRHCDHWLLCPGFSGVQGPGSMWGGGVWRGSCKADRQEE